MLEKPWFKEMQESLISTLVIIRANHKYQGIKCKQIFANSRT